MNNEDKIALINVVNKICEINNQIIRIAEKNSDELSKANGEANEDGLLITSAITSLNTSSNLLLNLLS